MVSEEFVHFLKRQLEINLVNLQTTFAKAYCEIRDLPCKKICLMVFIKKSVRCILRKVKEICFTES